MAGLAAQTSGVFEDPTGALKLEALLAAAEQVRDLGAGDAGGSVLRRGPDLIGGPVAEAVTEDPGSGVGAFAPDREACLAVGEVDVL